VRNQPAGRITAIQEQQITGGEAFQMLESICRSPSKDRTAWLPGSSPGRQIEGESTRLVNHPGGGVLEEQLHFGGIAGHHPQSMPSRDRSRASTSSSSLVLRALKA